MGDRISVSFKNGNNESVALFSHWDGLAFRDEARDYVATLKTEAKESKGVSYPLYRLEPDTVMVDFIVHQLARERAKKGRITSNYYLAKDDTKGDNSDNGHHIIDLD